MNFWTTRLFSHEDDSHKDDHNQYPQYNNSFYQINALPPPSYPTTSSQQNDNSVVNLTSIEEDKKKSDWRSDLVRVDYSKYLAILS